MNLYGSISDYLSLCCAILATLIGMASYNEKLFGMIAPDQVSSFLGLISVAGLAIINVYSFFRSALRQHNLADAEAMKETLKGKYEAEIESKELFKRRAEELQAILNERNDEIAHLRQQICRPNNSQNA